MTATISDDAVEAVARAIYRTWQFRMFGAMHFDWEKASNDVRKAKLSDARAAIRAYEAWRAEQNG